MEVNDPISSKNNIFYLSLKRKILYLDLPGWLCVLSRGVSLMTELCYYFSTFMTDNCALELMILLPVNLCLLIHYKIL